MERNYREYWASLTVSHGSHPANRFRYELLAKELDRLSVKPLRILDCGCGDGSLLSVIGRHLPAAELHGMDVADNVPLHRAGVNITFRQHDLGTPVPSSLHE